MENNVEKAISNFIGTSEEEELKNFNGNAKKIILNQREGLIERVDRLYITEDGRQLLREQY